MVYDWLDNALDAGITEQEFWNMTFAELERAMRSARRVEKEKAKQNASYDYLLADLIGKSISRLYGSSNKMPSIEEAYPSLFDSKEMEEKRAEKKQELSALRFKLFTQSFNQNFKGGENKS